VLVLACVGLAAAMHHDDATAHKFASWMNKYDKSYDSEAEFEHAFHNFMASIERVKANNKRTGKHYYGLTKFSDLSPAEFKRTYLRADHTSTAARDRVERTAHRVAPKLSTKDLPPTLDWRTNDAAVTPVKDQGQCGSCWAFSATENIESMSGMKTGKPVILSPEQIVDCDQGRGDQGCGGGDTPTAFEYVTAAGGIELDSVYPYSAGGGQAGSCQFDKSQVVVQIANFTWAIKPCANQCDNQDPEAVRAQLDKVGPLAICVYAQTWQDYQGGIFDDSTCVHGYQQLDHCVQLVGYDWSKPGQEYWIVRNSWNAGWGEAGYINIAMAGNICGVMDEVNYANIA